MQQLSSNLQEFIRLLSTKSVHEQRAVGRVSVAEPHLLTSLSRRVHRLKPVYVGIEVRL
jgi:hypothetical protein